MQVGSLELIWGNMFSGKCLGKDTGILLFGGGIKKVQDVGKDDLLTGSDFQARKVLSTNSGYGDLYRVTQSKGMTYIVNEHHILSLKNTFAYDEYNSFGKVVNIPIKEYLQMHENTAFKKYYKGYRYDNGELIFSDLDVTFDGKGEYFGFTIDGNHLFMLEDMTVTHNTTELLRRLTCDAAIKRKVLYINNAKDDRAGDQAYSTHNSLYKEKLGVDIDSMYRSVLPSLEEIGQYDTIGIDEGQFFENLDIIYSYVEVANKRVIISGLNGDSSRQKFD